MIDTDGAPKIKLAGKEWPVPLLAAKQNKIIDPLIMKLIPIFAAWKEDKGRALSQVAEEQYESLQIICYTALKRANPQLTRDEFDDLPISLHEMIEAFPVIAEQTGLFVKQSSESAASQGE